MCWHNFLSYDSGDKAIADFEQDSLNNEVTYVAKKVYIYCLDAVFLGASRDDERRVYDLVELL